MKKLSNEVKIGLVVLTAILIGYLGYRIMKDEPFFSSPKILYTTYDDVGKLIKGSNVYLNGFPVGSVDKMTYMPEVDSISVKIVIKEETIRIPVGSKALFVPPDVLGNSSINIIKSSNQQIINWGDHLIGTRKTGLMDSFSEKGTSIADSVTTTLTLVNELLRSVNDLEKNKGQEVGETITNLKQTSEVVKELFERRKLEVDSIIVDARHTLKNMSAISDSSKDELVSFIHNLEDFSQDLDVLSEELKETTTSLNSILSKIDTGEGTLGKMVNDPSLYNNLDSLAVNFNELIKGIEKDPRRYLKHMRLVEVF